MDDKHSDMGWWERWKLNKYGRCEHVKNFLKDTEPIGVVEIDEDSHLPNKLQRTLSRWEVFRCKTCGYIYCGRWPLKYFIITEKKYCDMKYEMKTGGGEKK